MEVLLAWIGRADLDARAADGQGPILGALRHRAWPVVQLLADWPDSEVDAYAQWLRSSAPDSEIRIARTRLTNPNAFGEIYRAAVVALEALLAAAGRDATLTYHLSPGTPAMASVWLILSKTRFPGGLIESSAGRLNTVEAPLDIAAELLPDLLRLPDQRLADAHAELPRGTSRFGDILYRSNAMAGVMKLARRAAARQLPVLIEGESGTGKELLARAIHAAGPRSARPLVVVNCGAIPHELVESRLFGHVRGAFTGAFDTRKGCFEDADGGTLFLDELGELPVEAQVKLLRVVQEGEVVRIGESRARAVDVRIVAATNRDLFADVVAGRFREDLFYRLAVLMLRLPPLREREGDLGFLIDELVERLNTEMSGAPLFMRKTLSAGARNLMLAHSWPGNVRELQNTLRRALVWSDGDAVSTEEMQAALLPRLAPAVDDDAIMHQPLGNGFDLGFLYSKVRKATRPGGTAQA